MPSLGLGRFVNRSNPRKRQPAAPPGQRHLPPAPKHHRRQQSQPIGRCPKPRQHYGRFDADSASDTPPSAPRKRESRALLAQHNHCPCPRCRFDTHPRSTDRWPSLQPWNEISNSFTPRTHSRRSRWPRSRPVWRRCRLQRGEYRTSPRSPPARSIAIPPEHQSRSPCYERTIQRSSANSS